MQFFLKNQNKVLTVVIFLMSVLFISANAANAANAADSSLLDALLKNGALTQEQYDNLIGSDVISDDDVLLMTEEAAAETETLNINLDENIKAAIDDAVDKKVVEQTPIKASYGSKGFRLETRDGNFQTNLQWRAQLRYSNPNGSDPRQLDDFAKEDTSDFTIRRARMKIGGHGFKPWLKYYFEVDLQPSRDVEADSQSSAARLITWRADIAKYEQLGLRLGQWKIGYNRERVDSSGKQEFVERSIVNRVFTLDRQVGIAARGRLFKGSVADMRYDLGIYNGEGRSVTNEGEDHMYMGRLQWNFLKRDVPFRQSDVEFTEKPAASLAIAAATNTGRCTRWSSSGCGNLDGFKKTDDAKVDQYEIRQAVQEFAFKYRGLSIQQEWHRKFIKDNHNTDPDYDLTGFYLQSGYFFHGLFDSLPEKLELAGRYAYVKEPNETQLRINNKRKEYTAAVNYFYAGHRNKVTVDISHLTLDDGLAGLDADENRIRFQWDVSF
jgi:phosphate-selective porin OprO and OprP